MFHSADSNLVWRGQPLSRVHSVHAVSTPCHAVPAPAGSWGLGLLDPYASRRALLPARCSKTLMRRLGSADDDRLGMPGVRPQACAPPFCCPASAAPATIRSAKSPRSREDASCQGAPMRRQRDVRRRPTRHTVRQACQIVRERDFRLVADRIENLSTFGMLVSPADPVLTGEKVFVS